jgi:hypothetical protein
MDHEYATAAQVPERYVFGELPPKERDEFEEHLADCSHCLQGVTMAQAFAANTREVFREQAAAVDARREVTPVKIRWFAWLGGRPALTLSGGLNLALAGAAFYAVFAVLPAMQLEIRELEKPAITESFAIAGAARGAERVYAVDRNSFAHFRFDLPRHFDHYEYVIEKVANGERKTYNLRGDNGAETLDLTVPVAGLKAGNYKVQVSGSVGTQSELLASFILRVTSGR